MKERAALLCLAITSLSWQVVSSFLTTPTTTSRPLSRGTAFASWHCPSLIALPRLVTDGSSSLSRRATRLWGINLDSNDAFEILDLKPTPDLDKKQIKRAYRRLALKYHPDVVTNQSSTKEEKKKAGDVFAKINWAYETLSGKNGEAAQPAGGASSAGGGSTAGTGYQPPHRRTGSYANPNASTDWKDYMPKYDDEDYDAGGDSFGSIFSDLFTSAAVGATTGGGGGGIFKDFVDFLESNVDGYSGDSSSDSELYTLLTTGNLEDVGNEVDDTELVVTQLSSKMKNINDELLNVKADLNLATKYMEKLDLEERVAELEARKKVVQGYVKKARKRLVSLQTRYKELIVGGSNDRRAGGRSSRSSSGPSPSSSSYSASGYRSNASERATSTGTSSTGSKAQSEDDDAWKRQGFGSSGRRGSSRRRRGSTQEEPAPPRERQTRQQAEPSPPPPRPEPTYQRTPVQRSPAPSSTSSSSSNVPPHRRTSDFRRDSEDKKRMREIKVDEEFDKLKKELGL